MKNNNLYNILFSKVPDKLLKKLKKLSFGIAGCGGLGSNIAIALARSGVKKIVLVDYDKIEYSNLNRQQYFIDDIGKYKVDALKSIIKKINPFIEIETYIKLLNKDNIENIFKDCFITFEAFDSISSKSEIIKGFLKSSMKNSFLIGASGVSGYGIKYPLKVEYISENILIIGDFITEPEKDGLVASKVIMSAMFQVNVAFDIIMGKKKL